MYRKSLWGLFVGFLFIVLLLGAGCAGPGTGPGAPDGERDDSAAGAPYPPRVQEILESVKFIRAGLAVVEGEQTYVLVSYGEQRTAGYEARIVRVETDADHTVVTTELTGPGEQAAQVITYPCAVEVLPGVYREVLFREVDGEYFPRIVGLPGPLNVVDRSDNIVIGTLETDPDWIRVAGIARVFEGTVCYELLDAAGNAVGEGFVTAASGGPDWGYFEIEVADPPAGAATLEVFQVSAKDGSRTDVVALPLCSS